MLDPDKVYRVDDAMELFGIGRKQVKEKVKTGDIPAPHLLSAPPSRARGWYGSEIIAYRERLAEQQEAWAVENATKYYRPKGGDVRKTNPQPKTVAVTKRRLRPRKPRGSRS